jgi:AcrR family transcriptional regulator
MPRRKPLSPRKQPKQERSTATVEAILQAATYILVRRGWEGFTTNLVAKRAGVNVASLYQYFPNKEAIVAELQRRHVQQARANLPSPTPGLSLSAYLRLMIEAGVREHRVAPALHRVFSEELPRSSRLAARAPDAETRWPELAAPLLRTPHPELVAFVARTAVHAVIHEAASERPELLDDPRLVEELMALLDGYLVQPRAKPSVPAT